MLISCPKEVKDCEARVALTPQGVKELVSRGHTVLVQEGAGQGSGISDGEFIKAGAKLSNRQTVFNEAEMIVKVKEPLQEEIDLVHEGQILFAFLHLAADKGLTKQLLDKKVIAIGCETVELADGSLPILIPMSIIAGRLAPQVGAACLQSNHGGRGILLGGVPGIPSAEVVILGAGNVGLNAAKIASGMGARVTIMGISEEARRLDYISSILGRCVDTRTINAESVSLMAKRADLLIGCVLVKGARAPKIVTRDIIKNMKPGSVIVDVSVDQGGCAETTHPTTHSNPTYVVDNVIHYCVTNMPGIVARTSTFALTNVTLPYVLRIACEGIRKGIQSDKPLAKGVNIYKGQLTSLPVSECFVIPYVPLDQAVNESNIEWQRSGISSVVCHHGSSLTSLEEAQFARKQPRLIKGKRRGNEYRRNRGT